MSPAFTIRDGVMFIAPWEWQSDEGMILGHRIEDARIVDGIVNLNRSVGLTFHIPPHITGDIFWQHAADESDRATLYLNRDGYTQQWVDLTADKILEHIAAALGIVACPGPARQEGSP